MSNGRIPKLSTWCSYCIAPASYGNPAGPCADHRGPDGESITYTGSDAYEPSAWVLEVVGSQYTAGDWLNQNSGEPITYDCFGYDPRNGFWMRRVDKPEEKRNIIERAIDRTYHRVRRT